jgi:hypothetical protein
MQTVKHKMFGIGEVINREVKDNRMYITVEFENGKEMRFAIPDSFTLGIMDAEGNLKDEVDAAIAEKKAREQARLEQLNATSAAVATSTPSNRHGRTPTKPITIKSSFETAFEEYLIDAGYETETPSGHPSTVYAYSGAINRHVLENERITWAALRSDIDNIVKKYDVGGKFEHIGSKSNNTVINALKRFREFVNP